MSEICIATHQGWGITATGKSPQAIANELGCASSELDCKTMQTIDYLLDKLPTEFRSVLSYMAYERGHSAGQAEVELILAGLVNDLSPAILAFEKRLTAGNKI